MLSLLLADYGIDTHFYYPTKRDMEELQNQVRGDADTSSRWFPAASSMA